MRIAGLWRYVDWRHVATVCNALVLWPPCCVADADIIFLPCGFFYFFLSFIFISPNLSRRRLDVYHTSLHTWCGLGANLGCRCETCCTRINGNVGRKKSPKNRHLGPIAQICRAISSYRESEKVLNSKISSTCLHNMVNFGLLMLRSVYQFGTPVQILTGFAYWQRYCRAL